MNSPNLPINPMLHRQVLTLADQEKVRERRAMLRGRQVVNARGQEGNRPLTVDPIDFLSKLEVSFRSG
jgi:hypothetical protein